MIMSVNSALPPLPASYTATVVEKSNLLLRANLLEAQQQFDDAAELFAKAARIEAQLATIAQQYGQVDTAIVHFVSEMSCWAAAGDTYRALARGQELLALATLAPAQRTHIADFVQQVAARRRTWMQSWGYAVAATS
jgi:tetratricopeptide (TPR) repeat protein